MPLGPWQPWSSGPPTFFPGIATPTQQLPYSRRAVAVQLKHCDDCIAATQVSLHQAAFVRPSAAGGQRLRGLASASQVSAPTNDNPFLG